MTTEIVRGEGNAPGQGPGEAMPSVPANVQPKSASDFQSYLREKNNAPQQQPARAPQQQTAKGRIGDFQSRLEARQEAPTAPGEPRDKPAERDEREPPDQQQIAENAEQPLETPPEEKQPAEETEPEQQAALDDKAALERYRELEQSPMLSDELAAEKMREVKINGRTYYHTVKELEQMAMRGGDYRQKSAELQNQQRAIATERQSWQQHWEHIKDPDAFIEIFERNGYEETMDKAFWKWAERKEQERSIVRAAGLAVMQKLRVNEYDQRVQEAMTRTEQGLIAARQAGIRQRQIEFRERQLQQLEQQRQSQQTQDEWHGVYERQLNQLRPLAFRAVGMKDTPANRQALNRHLWNAIQQTKFDGNITRDLVLQAANDLQEEQADARAREQGLNGNGAPGGAMTPEQWKRAQRAAAARKALPPTRLGGGGGQPLANNNGVKQGRLSDLEAMVRENRLRG